MIDFSLYYTITEQNYISRYRKVKENPKWRIFLTKNAIFLLFCEFLRSNTILNATIQVEMIDFSLYYTITREEIYIEV